MSIPQFIIEYLIYFYLVICGGLLLYNVVYILDGYGRGLRHERRVKKWRQEIIRQLERAPHSVHKEHKSMILGKLRFLNQLLAYAGALESLAKEYPQNRIRVYFLDLSREFQSLCAAYAKRGSMERAYFAWFAARFRPCREEQTMFRQLLVGYLADATVYCRENVLLSLYSLGDEEAVEMALQFLQDKGIFHHTKLLGDGLLKFTGDKEKLAWRLWSHKKDWNSNLLTAVVQFCTNCSSGFQDEFLEVLKDGKSDKELRFAVLRYFRRYPYEAAKPLLQSLSLEEDGDDLAIVAAFALDKYPGEDTVAVLRQALSSRNWYVRSNAAASLINLGAGEDTLVQLRQGGDRYAREMLEYKLRGQHLGKEAVRG